MSAILDRDTICPHDGDFVHRNYFGCVPCDFSERTGRSRRFRQRETVVDGLPWHLWLWNGGCDAAGVTTQQKLAEGRRKS